MTLVGSLHVSHTPAKFGGHKHHGSGGMKVFVYHVTLQDHMAKGSRNMVRSHSSLVSVLARLVEIGTLIGTSNEYFMALLCHMILQNHVIKWSCDFMGKSPSR